MDDISRLLAKWENHGGLSLSLEERNFVAAYLKMRFKDLEEQINYFTRQLVNLEAFGKE